jgi:hypothetical protein
MYVFIAVIWITGTSGSVGNTVTIPGLTYQQCQGVAEHFARRYNLAQRPECLRYQ